MKRIFKVLGCLLFAVFICFGNITFYSKAEAVGQTVTQSMFENEINIILAEIIKYNDRTAGSEDEKKLADFIHQYLSTNENLVPKSNAYIEDGIQNFTFESTLTGKYETSQNVIFGYSSGEKNAKKVIIGCNYDAIALKNAEISEGEDSAIGNGSLVKTEGVNTSASSVATLLATSKFLNYNQINFDIEFVFFGAGESNYAGSKIYANGIADENKSDILAMINFDNIALGENLYFYMDEIETKNSKFVGEVAYKNQLDISKVDTTHLAKIENIDNGLGLNYSHIAMESDAINFTKKGIPSINIFAGDYNSGLIVGRCEFLGKNVVSYTANDNIEYITENYGFDAVNKNLFEVFKSVDTLLTDFDFQNTFANTASTSWFYKIFANEKLVVYLTVFAFLALIVVATFIHYKLSVKAYHANVELEFLSSVVKISEEIDKKGEDSNVPKVVSQVIASDIKKDKTIKQKKKDRK